MDSALREIVRFLALTSVQVCVLGAVAFLAVRWARASARTTCRILAIVAALPVLSLLAEGIPDRPVKILPAWIATTDAAIAQRPGGEPRVAEPVASPAHGTPAPQRGPMARDRADLRASRRSGDEASQEPGPALAAASAAPGRPIDPVAMLGVAWLAVLAVLAVRVVRRSIALRSLLRAAAPPTDRETLRIAEACIARAGLSRRPRVLVSDACAVPFVSGLFAPCAVVPRRLSGARLEYALLHELAHVRHRDHLWVVPELALRTLYFFHPLMQRVLDRLHEEREHRSDLFVTRLTGRCAPYAEFLLDEVSGVTAGSRDHAVLALRSDGEGVARRVRRILQGGENAMSRRTPEIVACGAVAIALTFTLACGTVTAEQSQEAPAAVSAESAPDHINATPTGTAGRYHVMPVFERVTEVVVIQRGGPYGKEHEVVLQPGDGYSLDAATGDLDVKRAIDDAKQMVLVRGVRTIPWAWQAREPLLEGSVRVLLGDREGKRGVDFEVDEAKGRIRFLRKEDSGRETHYFISFAYPRDPRKPQEGRAGSIGNHPDRDAVRRFLGLGEPGATAADPSKSVGTNASPTDDPRRWTIVQPMEASSVRVGVAVRGAPEKLRWLERPADYDYDETAGTISFRRDVAIDKESEFVFVQGIPRDRRVFLAHRKLGKGDVSVTVDGRKLADGTGFTVDLATGRITVLDGAITRPGAKYRIEAGGWTYGN